MGSAAQFNCFLRHTIKVETFFYWWLACIQQNTKQPKPITNQWPHRANQLICFEFCSLPWSLSWWASWACMYSLPSLPSFSLLQTILPVPSIPHYRCKYLSICFLFWLAKMSFFKLARNTITWSADTRHILNIQSWCRILWFPV